MDKLIQFFSSIDPIWAAFIATCGTWMLTAIGASVVFFTKNISSKVQDGLLGFTGGVMIAASIWSLLIPAIDMSTGDGFQKVIPASVGFILGSLFLFGMDKILPHLHVNLRQKEGPKSSLHRTTLMVLAITLHNIPEGLAVGILFGGVAAGVPEASITGATILAIGIGLQNLPEGMAVALPIRRMGLSRTKSFVYGQSSAMVEPIAAVIGAVAVTFFTPMLPYALAFAAGAMIFVVIEEVIPETQQNKNTDLSVLGFILGFVVMMMLDVGLS